MISNDLFNDEVIHLSQLKPETIRIDSCDLCYSFLWYQVLSKCSAKWIQQMKSSWNKYYTIVKHYLSP